MKNLKKITQLSAITLAMLSSFHSNADQQILDDLIVTGSICTGFDCVNGESFGFDTLRLKENNLRIKFQDTSSSSSFPTTDWQITVNDSSNGGLNKFSIEEIDAGTIPFTILQTAPNNSFYMASNGNIGLGTSTPLVDLVIKQGNTPTLRLEQDASSGFAAQTWDVGGNESNFFVRDVTNGSKLPFRIAPSAPNSSIHVAADGDVGFNTSTPDGKFDVAHSSDANNHAFLIDTNSYVGVNIDNGQHPAGLFDVQTTGGVSKFTVAADGDVGVGTNTPTGRFDVQTTGGVSRLIVTDTGVVQAATPFGTGNKSDTALLIGDESRYSTYFIGHTINSGLNDTSDNAGIALNYKGHQAGTDYYRDTVFFDGKTNLIGNFDGSSGGLALGQRDATNILTVVQNSATDPIADAWTTYSSRRWKKNIQTIENAIDTVMSMRGVTYNWKESGKSDIGFIAEEVGEILPEIVAYEKNGIDAQSVDYSRVVPLLIEAIKAQQVELDLLKEIVSESN